MALSQALYAAMPVPAQNALVSAYGYYLKRKRYGPGADAVRALTAESRTWGREQVDTYQRQQLARVLQTCAAVPYYREVSAGAGEIRSVADLERWPILSKDAVRRRGDELHVPGARAYWVQHTSGSTGTPVVILVNRHTYQLVHALLSAHEADCGVAPTDLRATLAGRMVQPAERLQPPFWRYNHAERQLIFSAYHLAESTLPAYVAELTRRQPAEIIGYPSAIAVVANFLRKTGAVGVIRPKVVVTNSETLFAWQRDTIEQAFHCPVRDYYGSAESVVFAPQCAAGAYHFSPLLGVAEIVDRDGAAVQPGDTGRLLCTTLTNDVMPLVRYEIGDDAVRLAGPCPCGSPLDGASEIIGRHDDAVVTPDGREVGRMDHIFKGVTGIRECQIVQESLDLIRLVLVADAGFDARQEQLLRQNALVRLGGGVRVEIERVAEIPRSRAGKFRGVLSKVTRP